MLKEGIHKISADEYHGDPAEQPSLSKSIMQKLLFEIPKKAFIAHPRLNPDFEKRADEAKFDIGTAAHSLLLEGEDNCEIIFEDSWRSKASQDKRDDAREEGRTPLLEHQYDKTIIMVEAAHDQIKACKDLGIENLHEDGDAELALIWNEKDEIGRQSWHRIRPDWMSNDRKVTLDYKTTGTSADPNEFSRMIFNMGYELQEGYYKRGIKAITSIDTKFIFVVQENKPPYLCSFIGLSPMFQEIGKQKMDQGIFLWNSCIESGVWPAYPDKVCYVEPPGWAMAKNEEKLANIGE